MPIPTRGAAFLWCAGIAACGESITVVPPPPVDASTRSVLLAMHSGSTFEVHALPVENGAIDAASWPIRLGRSVEPDARVRLEAIEHPRSLEARGLTAGPIASSADARAIGVPMGAVQRLDLVAGEAPGAWRETEERSAELAAFKLDRPPGDCVDFRARVENLAGVESPVLAHEVEPGVAVLGTDAEHLFSITDGVASRIETDIMAPAGDPTRGARTLFVPEPGVLWFGTYSGELVRARLSPSLTVEATFRTANRGLIFWLSGAPTASPVDLFSLTVDGVIEHFDGVTSRVVHQFSTMRGEEFTGGIAWVGPKEAIVTWHSELAVTRVRYDEPSGGWNVTREEAPGSTAAFITAAYNPRFGPIVGNSDGQIFTERGGVWREVAGSPIRVWAYALAPYGDGFVFGSAFGNFGQYTQSDGYCGIFLGQAADVRTIVPLAGGDIMLIGPSYGRTPSFAWLSPE